MHILAGLVLAIVLLYGWLVGHWFARVLAFLIFSAGLGTLGAVLVANGIPDVTGAQIVAAAICGGIAGWFVAALPTYYWRKRQRELLEAEWGIPTIPHRPQITKHQQEWIDYAARH